MTEKVVGAASRSRRVRKVTERGTGAIVTRETTTVRVRNSTRDILNDAANRSGRTVDDVILAGIAALEEEQIRRRMIEEGRQAAADPVDRAEVQAAIREALGL